MNIQLLALSMTMEAWKGLLDDAVNAAKQVGRREAKRANLYLVCEKQDPEGPDGCGPTLPVLKVITTFDNTAPGFYALLLCSVRWSQTRQEYVSVVNNFLEVDQTDPEYVSALWGSLSAGLEMGMNEWTAAQDAKPGTDADALLERGLFLNLDQGSTAWYADREDAEKWALLQSNGADYPWSVKLAVPGEIMEKAELTIEEVQAKLGEAKVYWEAWVSATPVE